MAKSLELLRTPVEAVIWCGLINTVLLPGCSNALIPGAIRISIDPGRMAAELAFEEVLSTPTTRRAEALADNDDPISVLPTFPMVALKLPVESGTDCCPLKLETIVVVGSIP
jgi:hypothetical protein